MSLRTFSCSLCSPPAPGLLSRRPFPDFCSAPPRVGPVAVFIRDGDVGPLLHQPAHHRKIVVPCRFGDRGGSVGEHHVRLVVVDIGPFESGTPQASDFHGSPYCAGLHRRIASNPCSACPKLGAHQDHAGSPDGETAGRYPLVLREF